MPGGPAALAAVAPPASLSIPPRQLPLLHASSLRFEGAFRLPTPESDHATFDYGGTAIAHDPRRNGLFAVGHDWYQLTAEVSIPRASRADRVAALPRARAARTVSRRSPARATCSHSPTPPAAS